MTSLLKRLLVPVFALLAAVLLLPPAVAQEGPVSMPGTPVPLILDPTVSTFRLAPKSHPQVMKPMATTVTVSYVPAGSYGTWGDLCEDWPPAARTAFEYAAGIWAGYLDSSVPIVIQACWTDMGSPFILGHGGATSIRAVSGVFYPQALVNNLYGYDQNGADTEISVAFNETFNWYFGTDGNPGSGVDFVSVVLHEVCHGLGFAGSMSVSSLSGSWGFGFDYPMPYDQFAVNGSGDHLIDTSIFPNPSNALYLQLISNNLYFDGANAVAANGGSPAKIYAPSSWNPGSSYAHLDYATYSGTQNALMVYMISYGSSIHAPGPVTLGILKDIGWSLAGTCAYSIDPQGNSFDLNGGTGSVGVTTGVGCDWTAVSNSASWLHVTSGTPGSGSGTAGYSVDPYTGTGNRQGTMTIGGQIFTVTQSGCTYTLTPDNQTFTYSGGTATFSVETNGADCPWNPDGAPTWVTVDTGTGPGAGTVNYTVDPNPDIALRSSNINVGDKTFAITQTGVLPAADFINDVTSGDVPFQAAFTDSSVNATSWLWDFGDGETSTLQNPTHTYKTTTGSPFTVTLTASNINGSDAMTATINASACANGPVRYSGAQEPGDGKIATAYLNASSVDEIDIQALIFPEVLTLGLPKNVTLKGGYDCGYSATRIPDTEINGSLTISGGTITVDEIVIK